MRRRAFILSVFGTIAAGVPILWYIKSKTFSSDLTEIAAWPEQLSLIAEEKDIFDIGTTDNFMLDTFFDESNLTATILERIPKQVYQPLLKPSELRYHLLKKIEREFEEGKIKVVKGWILSETEVRQCRLYAWLNSKN